ncbi:hypothetical protein ACFX2C_007200 [Malus domestica]
MIHHSPGKGYRPRFSTTTSFDSREPTGSPPEFFLHSRIALIHRVVPFVAVTRTQSVTSDEAPSRASLIRSIAPSLISIELRFRLLPRLYLHHLSLDYS